MTETIYRCNNPQCRKVKAESNHWIAFRVWGGGVDVVTEEFVAPFLKVVTFKNSLPTDEHYCGPACATRRFTEYLDELRATKAADP